MSNTTENKNNTINTINQYGAVNEKGEKLTINTYNGDYVEQCEFEDELTKGFYLHMLIAKLTKNKIKVPTSLLTDLKDIKEKHKTNKDFTIGLQYLNKKHPQHKRYMELMKNGTNKVLLDIVDKKVKQYKTLNKFIDPEFEKKEITIITLEGEVGKDTMKLFKTFLSQKEKAPCFCWNQHLENFSWLDTPDLQAQFKIWKSLIKEGRLLCKEEWKTSGFVDKTEWFGIVVKQKGNDTICVGSLKLFRQPIHGFVYWFNKETNRDAMLKYLLK